MLNIEKRRTIPRFDTVLLPERDADRTFTVEHERSAGEEEIEFQVKWKSGGQA